MLSKTLIVSQIPSIDESESVPATLRRWPMRLMASAAIVLACSLIGAAALSDVTADVGDFSKVVGVLAFIVSMVVLAIGMVGESYRS